MKIEVITPEKEIFTGDVDAAQFPGIDGFFQVLNDHAPIISALSPGKIKIDLKDAEQKFEPIAGVLENDPNNNKVIFITIKGGVVEMKNNVISVLAS